MSVTTKQVYLVIVTIYFSNNSLSQQHNSIIASGISNHFFSGINVNAKKYAITNNFLLAVNPTKKSNLLQDTTSPNKKVKFKWAMDILAFGRKLDFINKTGSLNPNNYVAQLDDYDAALFFRPSLQVEHKKLQLAIQPRFNTEYDKYNKTIDYEAYFQKLQLKYQLSKSAYVKAGRYFKQIGNGLFINPSNPFFPDPQRINPKLEVRPMDFVEVVLSNKKNAAFSLIANLSKGESTSYKDPFFSFVRRYAFQVEKSQNASQVGALLSADEKGKFSVGGYGQKTIGEAIVIWTDMGLDYNINRFYATAGHSTNLINYDMVNDVDNKKFFYSGLAGISYTLKGGATFYLEYFYNGKAYSKNQNTLYNNMVATASNYNFDITKELSKRNLARAINNGNVYQNNNYLFAQFVKNDIFDKLNIAARYFFGIDDYSNQSSLLIEYNPLDNVEIFATSLFNIGNSKTEFRRIVNHQISIGLIYKL